MKFSLVININAYKDPYVFKKNKDLSCKANIISKFIFKFVSSVGINFNISPFNFIKKYKTIILIGAN